MLRTQSKKSRPDIKQRKSTSPVRPSGVHLEHIDIEHARRDAHTAATEAFVRSQQRNNAIDTPLFPDPVPKRAKSTRDGLKRQQSVRFVADRDDGSDTEHMESRRSKTRSGPGTLKVGKERGDVRGKENLKPLHDGNMNLSDELVVSSPTFNLGLRRSKSMISGVGGLGQTLPERTSSVKHSVQARGQARSDSPPASSATRSIGTNDVSILSLRAPKSMSFLRSLRRENSQNESVVSRASSHKEAENHAEAQSVYSQRTTISGRLRAAPSMLLRSGSVRSIGSGRRSMRMSMRDRLDQNIPTTIGSAGVGSLRSRNSSLTGKARRASQTLKSRIKTLFGRGSKDNDKRIGVEEFEKETEDDQQQDAASNSGGSIRTSLSLGVGSMQEEGTLSQVSSRVPTVKTLVQEQLIRSRRGSLTSLQSECRMTALDDVSRATSWGSSGHSTVASQQQAWSDWQQQRLSVITENAAGISSPQDRQALNAESAEDKRVYSALAKRLAERQQLFEAGSKASYDDSGTHRNKETQVGKPVNSVYPTVGESEGGTIRCVTASTETVEHCQIGAPAIPKLGSPAKVVNRWTASVSSLESTESEVKPRMYESRCSTPDLPSLGMPRSNRSSAFFGSPSCHLFRTASPYRRALKESNKAALAAAAAAAAAHTMLPSPLGNSVESLKLPGSIMSGQPWTVDETAEYSESVYSGDENSDHVKISESKTAGKVAKGDDGSDKATKTVPDLSRRNVANSSDSIDWKTWLAANVSKLEMQPSPVHGNGPVSHQRHRREETQIYDDADDDQADEDNSKLMAGHRNSTQVEQTTVADEEETTPLGVVQHNITRAPSYHVQVESSTLAENQAPRTPISAKSGLTRARSLHGKLTNADGSPCRPQAPASVKLVRRTAAVDTASREKLAMDKMAQQTVTKAEVGHEKTTATTSRRMVDLFLSSRRRRMASSKDTGDAFV